MNIKFATSESDQICSQIRSAKLKGDGAIGKVSRARNVDSDISSRLNISGDFQYLANNVSIEIGRLESLIKALRNADTEFEEADSSVRSRSKNVTAIFRKAQREAYLESFYTGIIKRIENFIKKGSGLLTVFGLGGIYNIAGPIAGAVSVILLGRLTEIIKTQNNAAPAVSGNSTAADTSSDDQPEKQESEEGNIDPYLIMNADNVIHFKSQSNPNKACVMWSLTGLVRRMQALHGQESLIEAKTIYEANGNTNTMQSWNKSSDLSNTVEEQTGFNLGYIRNGGGRTVESLNNHLSQHEAGLVCYFGGKKNGPYMAPHAVLITRVEDGRYYCIDYTSKGATSSMAQEIPLEESSLVKDLHYPADYKSLMGYLNEIVYIK